MKKILIITPSFNSGGTTTSLMNISSSIDKSKYEIWVYPINNEGPNRDYIAQHCHIIGADVSKSSHPATISDRLRRQLFWFVKKLKKRLEFLGIDIAPLVFRTVAHKLDAGNYDFVVAFQEGLATRFCSYFKHGKKIAWVRAEYGRYLSLSGVKPEAKLYGKYDTIVNVSQAAAENFLSYLPMYRQKTHVLYNVINADRVLSMSSDAVDDITFDTFTIVSVGRIDPVKRFSEIPRIASALSEKGLHFKWLIIGGVASEDELKSIKDGLAAYHQEENVFLLGRRANPYPYMKKSNLLVCLSSSETFNNTLTEAKILGVPVVTTDFACACESIREGFDGFILPIDNIQDKIAEMIGNKDIYDTIRKNLSNYKHSNAETFDKLYSVILK